MCTGRFLSRHLKLFYNNSFRQINIIGYISKMNAINSFLDITYVCNVRYNICVFNVMCVLYYVMLCVFNFLLKI